MSLFHQLAHNVVNIPGWKTDRKFVVIQSDDWGTIRMPSRMVYEKLLREGIRVDQDLYSRYDALESDDDLSALFEVLRRFKDINGRSPVITANTIVANPDFERIKSSWFQSYYYEPFTETLNRNSSANKAFQLWKQGISEKLFEPQYHGREHVNVQMWLKALQTEHKDLLLAFEEGVFGIPLSKTTSRRRNYMAALDFEDQEGFEFVKNSVEDGLKKFENIFGVRSESVIAPCYVWHTRLESTFHKNGIRGIQGTPFQFQPEPGHAKFKKIYHYQGERNKYGQRHLIRNVFFEPTHFRDHHQIENIINRIRIAFRWRSPAIISSHRLNFIGRIDESNRSRNLATFECLLRQLLKTWPDIEFIGTSELIDLMCSHDS